MRINHVFQEAERGVRELDLQAEALAAFKNSFGVQAQKVLKAGLLLSILVFWFGDAALKLTLGWPEKTLQGWSARGKLARCPGGCDLVC